MRQCAFDEAPAEGAGVGEVDGELRVAVGALRRFVEDASTVQCSGSSRRGKIE